MVKGVCQIECILPAPGADKPPRRIAGGGRPAMNKRGWPLKCSESTQKEGFVEDQTKNHEYIDNDGMITLIIKVQSQYHLL